MTATLFSRLPIIMRTVSPIGVVGDIHGNLCDLLRIFHSASLDAAYLFLGDYVDRGPFSLECLILLFSLALKSPDRFLLIRGNHEFSDCASVYGFKEEILSLYDESVFNEFLITFSYMPFGAIIDGSIFCCHGGIGPGLETIRQIQAIQRPINDFTDLPIIRSLVWADPTTEEPRFRQSARALGDEFGAEALEEFLAANGFQMLVRGHQVVNGAHRFPGMSLLTVFSSSAGPPRPNRAAIVTFAPGERPMPVFFDPIEPLERSAATFSLVKEGLPSDRGGVSTVKKGQISKSASLGLMGAELPRGRIPAKKKTCESLSMLMSLNPTFRSDAGFVPAPHVIASFPDS
jgi:diadenosine tetraphosphatase ApaH/serine/threonine PP2A family protein phosphatase